MAIDSIGQWLNAAAAGWAVVTGVTTVPNLPHVDCHSCGMETSLGWLE